MKAKEIKGKVKVFFKLPNVWRDEDGTHFNFNKLSDEELKEKGFYDVVMPNYNNQTQVLKDIYFDGSNYTYKVENKVIPETLAELKEIAINRIKRKAQDKLSKTDWYVVRKSETGKEIPLEILEERQGIRTKSNDDEVEILALTTKAKVLGYEY